jgi:hypothetical protein
MNNYVSTLETKVKSQDGEINKLKESNEELNGSNRMMSSMLHIHLRVRLKIECPG